MKVDVIIWIKKFIDGFLYSVELVEVFILVLGIEFDFFEGIFYGMDS